MNVGVGVRVTGGFPPGWVGLIVALGEILTVAVGMAVTVTGAIVAIAVYLF